MMGAVMRFPLCCMRIGKGDRSFVFEEDAIHATFQIQSEKSGETATQCMNMNFKWGKIQHYDIFHDL